MNINQIKRTIVAGGATSLVLAASSFGVANAISMNSPTTTKASANATGTEQTRITAIKTSGDTEISRRLTTLGSLTSKITSASRLTTTDKAALSAEVSTEANGLNSLKTTLDNATTIEDAKTAAKSIYTDYRVYALVVPKVNLVRVADDQQTVEVKLTALAAKLQTRLDTAKSNGKDVTSMQTTLTDMTSKISGAQTISSSVQAKVINLQPTDFNSDHAILSGDRDQLKLARSSNQAAYADAKNIVAGLKAK